jgi:TonB family protein
MLAAVFAGAMGAAPRLSTAADLASVKELYAAASYEEALAMLGSVDAAADRSVVEQYRALCYLALGRTGEAEAALEALVTRNPRFTMQESEVSPRLVAMYRDVRTRALPAIARQEYTEARAKFDKEQFEDASRQFARALQVLNEAGPGDPSLADLRTLVEGFVNLAEAKAIAARPAPERPPPPVAVPPPAPAAAATAAPAVPAIFNSGSEGVTPPVELSRQLPAWTPRTALTAAATFRGTLSIVIDEEGKVESASLAKPITPEYDGRLIAAAKNWRFRPATRAGQPVKYSADIAIVLKP